MVPQHAARAYATIGLETGVAAASPHAMILMLYDGALMSIREASQHIEGARIAERGQAISRAISIIDGGLKASLDLRLGGEIAGWLDQLYDYMSRRLLAVSMRGETAGLDEVEGLLRELRGAWAEIANKSMPLPKTLKQQVAA
jgi:flagellar protein FliS